MSEEAQPARPNRRAATLVFALALGARLYYLVDSRAYPAFSIPIVDSFEYDRNARLVASGGELTFQFFWQPFFYPWFLSLVYRAGGSIVAAKVVQAVLGACTALLTMVLGQRVFGRRAGLAAGAIAALYGPSIFYETELLATGWAAFWAVALVLLVIEAQSRASLWPSVPLGLASGLSVLTRPTFLPFVLGAWAWLAWRGLRAKDGWRALGALGVRALLVLSSFALVTLPTAYRTLEATGKLTFLPASGGINVYLGNHPDMARMLTIAVGEEWRQLVDLPVREGVTGVWERQAFFYAKARELAREDPAGFAARLGRKALRLASSREIPRNVDVYTAREWSPFLGALAWKAGGFGFPFGVLLPLAVLGLVFRRRRLPAAIPLFLAMYGGSILAVFVTARYRIPLIPVLAALAGAGLVGLVDLARGRDKRRLAAVCAGALGVALLGTLPGPFAEEGQRFDAGLHAGVAYYHLRQGDKGAALDAYRRALELDPSLAEAHLNVGNLLAEGGRPADAEVHYRAALAQKPHLAAIHSAYGSLLLGTGRAREAVERFRAAIAADPTLAPLHANLGAALGQLGDHAAAVDAYREACRLRPADVRYRYGLGFALEHAGRLDEAIAQYELVARAAPGFQDVAARLERLRTGR